MPGPSAPSATKNALTRNHRVRYTLLQADRPYALSGILTKKLQTLQHAHARREMRNLLPLTNMSYKTYL